jgi:XRE family aerobic/anaerobic benzoate catabolism transcriptional regulator
MTDQADPETAFLEQLGQRVRTMRGLRGMSRKVLAKVSGISERYIAQLESGKGNVSIVLLRRVSGAMGAHLEDLIPADEPSTEWPVIRDLVRNATPSQIAQAKDVLAGRGHGPIQNYMSFNGIALIGLRGAGKSTLGKLLADKIGWSFVELNKEIEQHNGLSVAEIIALYGQEGFRRMEQAALNGLLGRKEPIVLATGGGIVSEPVTFDRVLSSFYTIWLKAKPEEHMARVRRQGDLRPMADDRSAMQELRTILLSREPLYARASAIVDTAGLSKDKAAAQLVGAVSRMLNSNAEASDCEAWRRDTGRIPAGARLRSCRCGRDPQHPAPDDVSNDFRILPMSSAPMRCRCMTGCRTDRASRMKRPCSPLPPSTADRHA